MQLKALDDNTSIIVTIIRGGGVAQHDYLKLQQQIHITDIW